MKIHQRPFYLKELKIEVTQKCPLACIHCSSDATLTSLREIKTDKCIAIIKEAAEIGVSEIAFSGGEPLLWDGIYEAVEAVFINNIQACIYTSGNIENIKYVFERIKQKGHPKLIFSVYSYESIEHEKITRKRGSFNSTINSIKIAKELGFETELHFVALKQNYHLLKQVAELGKQIGISKISVLRFVPQGRGALLNTSVLDKFENIKLKKEIELLRREGYDIRTGSPFNVLLINNDPTCFSAINRLIIDPDLRIYPCDAFKNILAEEVTGISTYSTLQSESLKNCWRYSPYLETVRDYLTTDFTEPCHDCSVLEKCLSGCLAQKFIYYGSLEKKPDPACLLN